MTISAANELRDCDVFESTALLAGVSEDEWRSLASKLPEWPERHALLRELLKLAGRSPTILFCYGDQVLLQYEGVISFKWSPLRVRNSTEPIRGKNEVVDPSARLSAESLRDICVMIEALVYKCVHLRLKGQSKNYGQLNDTYESRLGQLVAAHLLTSDEQKLAMELYETRCQFAHSLRSIDELIYKSLPLKERWGSSGTMRTRELKRYFLNDAFRFSETLLRVFKPVQAQQIDGDRFRAELLRSVALQK